MNKKGFTLIELLAVIVILAIIALIATPIVLSIIDDTKKSSMLRSAEMYLNGVENSVMKENMNEGGNYRPNDCTITNGLVKCDDYEEIAVEVDGEVPQDGSTIKFENGKIVEVRLVYKSATIVMDEKNNLVFATEEETVVAKTLDTICTYDSTNGVAEKTAGAKYSCEVKEGTSYNFYVLTTPEEGDTTINLIMDQNINSDGTPAGMTGVTQSTNASQYNLVAWISDSTHGCGSDGDYCATNEKGPITAMTFLYNATKDWTNIDPVNYTYNDKTTQGTTAENTSYTSFVSTNGVATITALDGTTTTTIGSESTPLRARMPIYASDTTITEVTSKTNASYLYDNLDSAGSAAPYGYWTLSSYAGHSFSAWYVHYLGYVDSLGVFFDCDLGVRPVINLKI